MEYNKFGIKVRHATIDYSVDPDVIPKRHQNYSNHHNNHQRFYDQGIS